MQLCLLHLDDALKSQEAFVKTCERESAHQLEVMEHGSEVRLWGKQAQLDKLQTKLSEYFTKSKNEPRLLFMGSGDFHHITALLIGLTMEKQSDPITVIHFDNHPDWVKFEGGMHCGSWVNRALQHPKVSKVITIGVCSNDLHNPDWKGANLRLLSEGKLELFPYNYKSSKVRHDYGKGASYEQKDKQIFWRTIEEMGENAFIQNLLSRIQTKSVYITIDKDVLAREDAETNWDQGVMRLPFLLNLLRAIGNNHKIIGADVNGDYSTPNYSGSCWTKFKKQAEIYMDQPRIKPDAVQTSSLNSATNHALLDILSEIA